MGDYSDFDILKRHPARWFLQTFQMYVLVGIGAALGMIFAAFIFSKVVCQ